MKLISTLMSRTTAAILTFASLFALTGCIDDPEPESLVGVGDTLPHFSLTLNDGRRLDTDDLAGHLSLLVFFNTECPDCRVELPVIQQFHDRNPEVVTICIARSQEAADISAYWHENGLTMPWSAQSDASVFNLFATSGIPRVYMSDRALRITATWNDTAPATAEALEQALSQIE